MRLASITTVEDEGWVPGDKSRAVASQRKTPPVAALTKAGWTAGVTEAPAVDVLETVSIVSRFFRLVTLRILLFVMGLFEYRFFVVERRGPERERRFAPDFA